MLRVKEGDISAMAGLFERYHGRVYHFFCKLSMDQGASEDLTQQAFYRMIRYKSSFNQKEGSFKSWMYKIARNIHFDWLQKKKKEGKLESLAESQQALSARQAHEAEIERKSLHEALQKLKPEQRELILLSRFEGLQYREISRINGKSVMAIKVQIHRAIRQLKDFYFNKE